MRDLEPSGLQEVPVGPDRIRVLAPAHEVRGVPIQETLQVPGKRHDVLAGEDEKPAGPEDAGRLAAERLRIRRVVKHLASVNEIEEVRSKG